MIRVQGQNVESMINWQLSEMYGICLFQICRNPIYHPHIWLWMSSCTVAWVGVHSKYTSRLSPTSMGLRSAWWCCDALTSYPLNSQVYLGKKAGERKEVGQGARVVKDLVKPWYNTGWNVTGDNLFTTAALAEELLTKKMTYVGTVRKNKGEIPQAMQAGKNREVYSSIHGFCGSLAMVSYVPKKNKLFIVLSSQHHDSKVEGEMLVTSQQYTC